MALQDKIDLDELIQEILNESPAKADMKPFWPLAAMRIQFSPEEIKAACERDFGYKLDETDEQAMLEASFQNKKTGRYSLKDFRRKEILQKLSANGEISSFLAKQKQQTADANQQLFEAVLKGESPQISQLTLSQLVMLARITDWLEGTKTSLPPKAEINSLIKREELLRPFRKLTENFQGRQKRLDQITEYVDWLPQRTLIGKAQQLIRQTINWFEKPPLLISGIGGIGKSTLIAKFILQHAEQDATRKIPFIYLDFDRPGLSISEPMQLAAEGMRQLKLQFPDRAGLFDDIRRDILTYLERGQGGAQVKKAPATRGATRGIILEAIHRQYLSRFEEDLNRINIPVLVVLDSFEEAQYRATFSELNNLFQFLQEVAEAVPRFRPVIIGRSDLVVASFKFEKMYLESFDEQAARGYLKALGVKDESVARQIASKLGGNPLTLQLAAQIVKHDSDNEISSVRTRQLFARIDEKRIQGQLVRRNLDHIHDEEVRKLAVPGMLVRRINPEVIQQVLAGPCGLGEITAPQAEAIFDRLKKETFLLGENMGSLTFRQDLRVALYDLIVHEDREKAKVIHENAVEFYEGATTPGDQAEYLYHRLKLEENPFLIDQFFTEELRPYLESSLTEMPLAVYMRFATRLGITVGEEVLKNAPARELEGYFNLQIDEAIENGDEEGLRELEKLLQRYPQRTEPSSLKYHEAKLYFRLGNDRAVSSLFADIRSHWPPDLRSRILEGRWHESRRNYQRAREAMEEALSIAQKHENPVISWDVELLLALIVWDGRLGKGSSLLPLHYGLKTLPDFLINIDIPKPYRFKNHNLNKPLGGKENEIKRRDFEIFLKEISEKALKAEFFHDLHDRLKTVFTAKGELEQFLFNRFNLQLSDISEPGTFELNLLDLAKFLEQRDRKEYEDLFEEKEDTPSESGAPNDDYGFTVEEVKNLIAKDDLQQAIAVAKQLLKKVNPELENDIILLESRYNQNRKESMKGVLSREQDLLSQNRIRVNLLDLLSDMEEH